MLESLKRITTLADTGLLYATTNYDKERYEELKELSLDLLGKVSGHNGAILRAVFPPVVDYPTAKVDVRALVLSPQKEILLVQEQSDGCWSLPGGWADVGFSAAETAAKECLEETGLPVKVQRLLAVFDKSKHPHPPQAAYVFKMVFLCEPEHVHLEKGHDVLDVAFFPVSQLPPLSENRILASQIQLVYDAVLQNKDAAFFD